MCIRDSRQPDAIEFGKALAYYTTALGDISGTDTDMAPARPLADAAPATPAEALPSPGEATRPVDKSLDPLVDILRGSEDRA
eukprot:13082690-Alexandrium_andersonii.AAC.1